jgi:hypothetical protein
MSGSENHKIDISLEEITGDSLHLSSLFLSAIKAKMGDAGEKLEDMSVRDLQIISGLLTKVQRAQATLVKEQRALVKDAVAASKGLSYDQKKDLIVSFVAMMPVEHSKQLRERLGW